jgi:2-polyprenyl-3-methyl-5-hydroxy-6-metoxy-1,4-benzoquinol methylase
MPESMYFSNVRRNMRGVLPEGYAKVLEVGCGTGAFRANLGPCEYWGIEPNPEAAAQARTHLAHVLTGTFEAVRGELPARYFDLVVCNDVIEHMPDHDWFMEAIKAHMAPDARMVASIPNVRYLPHLFDLLARKEWKYEEWGLLDRTHLRFFTERSIRRTFRAHAYEVEALYGITSCMPSGKLTAKSLLRRAQVRLSGLILGRDVEFLQFAVRAKLGFPP